MNSNHGVIIAVVLAAALGAFMIFSSPSTGVVSLPNSGSTNSVLEEQIKNYILENPEVIEKSLNTLNEKRRDFANMKREQYLRENYQNILDASSNNPSVGSNEPKNYVIEFFDYNCSWCKKMLEVKDKALKNNPDVKFIFKELPILGDSSIAATRAALAVHFSQPEKYYEFHSMLLQNKGGIDSQEAIDDILKKANIDMKKYNDALENPEINRLIAETRQLAVNLGVLGTPAYIVNGKLIPGAFSYEDLEKLLK